MKVGQHLTAPNKWNLYGKVEKCSEQNAEAKPGQAKYRIQKDNTKNNTDVVYNRRNSVYEKPPMNLGDTSQKIGES